jgi:hypothetical protein
LVNGEHSMTNRCLRLDALDRVAILGFRHREELRGVQTLKAIRAKIRSEPVREPLNRTARNA